MSLSFFTEFMSCNDEKFLLGIGLKVCISNIRSFDLESVEFSKEHAEADIS
jgi:hypothetical protein